MKFTEELKQGKTGREVKPKNNNCDNDKCKHDKGEVRVLPTGGDSNAILCHACYEYELAFRRDRNKTLEAFAQFDLPEWDGLKVYATFWASC